LNRASRRTELARPSTLHHPPKARRLEPIAHRRLSVPFPRRWRVRRRPQRSVIDEINDVLTTLGGERHGRRHPKRLRYDAATCTRATNQLTIGVVIEKSKTDQEGKGILQPLPLKTASGLNLGRRLARLDYVLEVWGKDAGDALFAHKRVPSLPLQSSAAGGHEFSEGGCRGDDPPGCSDPLNSRPPGPHSTIRCVPRRRGRDIQMLYQRCEKSDGR